MKTVKGKNANTPEDHADCVWEARLSIHEVVEQILLALTRSSLPALSDAAEKEYESFKLNH